MPIYLSSHAWHVICYAFSERGIIGSLEKIYSKYVSKLESSEVHRSGCPLCHRTFNSNNEIADLVSEVNIIVNSGFLLPVVIIVILYNL